MTNMSTDVTRVSNYARVLGVSAGCDPECEVRDEAATAGENQIARLAIIIGPRLDRFAAVHV
jgi:hypothetical protein